MAAGMPDNPCGSHFEEKNRGRPSLGASNLFVDVAAAEGSHGTAAALSPLTRNKVGRRKGECVKNGRWLAVGKSKICEETRYAWITESVGRKFTRKVEISENSCEEPATTQNEENFFHSSWSRRRALVMAAMAGGVVSDGRLLRFRNCGGGAWVYAKIDTGEKRIFANYCHDKFCERCSQATAWCVKNNLAELVKGRKCLMICLTVKHDNDALSPLFDKLLLGFKDLRATDWWRKRVRGGAYTIESKYSERGFGWHPHIHALIECDYMDKWELSRKWKVVTGDSYNVDVIEVTSDQRGVGYVTKYLTKPIEAGVYTNTKLVAEAIKAMAGRRLIGTFGTWRDFELRGSPVRFIADEWKRVGPLDQIADAARRLELWAVILMAS